MSLIREAAVLYGLDWPAWGHGVGRRWAVWDQQARRPEVVEVVWLAAVPALLDIDGVSALPSVGTAFSTMRPR